MPALGLPHFLGFFAVHNLLWCDICHTHLWWLCEVHQVAEFRADIHTMMISDEQARLAADYLLASCNAHDCGASSAVSDVTFAAACAVAERTPDTRSDRVNRARALLGSPEYTSRDIASKMISRIISDCIR